MAGYYPPIDPVTLKNLLVIKRLAEEKPEYLQESPYPQDIFLLLKPAVHTPQTQEENIDVVQELQTTYTQLKNFKQDSTEPSAAMSYFRTAASLLEKLLENIERGKNAKQVSDFYRKVMELLDDLATPAQRTSFQEALQEWSQE